MHPLNLYLSDAWERCQDTAQRGHVSKIVTDPDYHAWEPIELRRYGDSLSGAFAVDFTIDKTGLL